MQLKETVLAKEIVFPEPFQGRMIIEIVEEDVTSYKKDLYGLSKDSKLVLPDIEDVRVPYKKGKILKMASDSFGKRYKHNYGDDCETFPKVGDVVMFVPNQQYKLDPAGKYALIADEQIVAFYKKDLK